jgi:Ca2+-binding RTX toxin-like protein
MFTLIATRHAAGAYPAAQDGSQGSRMTRRAQGILVALAVILAIALAAGGVMVLARSGDGAAPRTTVGSNASNRIIGTQGPDRIEGRGGNDTIRGRGGNDVLKGDNGGDTLNGGRGFDRLNGGRGGDTIQARDGHPDLIDCGTGKDTAIVDRHEDGVYDCERVLTPRSFQGQKRG